MTKKEKLSLQLKYERFQKYESFFTFNPAIKNKEDLHKYYNEEIEIIHKKCNRKTKIILSKWMSLHSVNKCVPKKDYLYLCTPCSQEIRNKNIQKKLDELYKGDFVLIGNYNGKKNPSQIKHLSCGKTFSIVGESLEKGRLTCKKCKKSNIDYETKKQKKEEENFKNELKEKGFNNFILTSKFKSKNELATFKHITCGEVFEKTPASILKLRNKDLCPKCIEGKHRSKKQIERNEYYQYRMDNINGKKYILMGDYKGQKHTVLVRHIDCGKEFLVHSTTLIYREYQCPYCETNSIKNNQFMTIKEKIKIYEDILNNEYSIMTPFTGEQDTIKIKHNKCGHTFERTVVTFLRSKGKMLCPKCREELRQKEFKQKIFKKFNGEYTPIGKYVNSETQMVFRHKTCKRKFKSTTKNFMNCKTPCPYCQNKKRALGMKKAQEKINKKFGNLFKICGIYVNLKTEMPVKCNACGVVLNVKLCNLIKRKGCPECNTEKI